MTRVYGITGSFGSGKSTVARMFAEFGVATQDADAVAKEVVAKGMPGLAKIVETFGPEVLGPDGELDRKRMADRVFADPEARGKLNAIVHPLVRARQAEFLSAHAKDAAVALEIPLLFESGAKGMFAKTIVVTTSEEARVERLRGKGFSDDEIAARLAAQMPQEKKIELADVEIANDGDPESTRRRVREFLESEIPSLGASRP